MKKILSIILALVTLFALVFTLGACQTYGTKTKPMLNLRKAESNLEDNGYAVYTDEEPLSSDYANEAVVVEFWAIKKDKYIRIYEFKSAETAKYFYNYYFKSEIDGMENELNALEYFLNEYEDYLSKEQRDEIKDEIKETKDYLAEYFCGYSGKFVWYATSEDAILDTKD